MIKNERQYRITKSQLEKFNADTQEMSEEGGEEAALFVAAARSTIEELEAEIQEYEALKEGSIDLVSIASFADLPKGLIMARIGRKLTQGQLAELVGLKEQQIQRWEADDYRSASLEAMKTIADALDLQFNADFFVSPPQAIIDRMLRSLRDRGVDKGLLKRILSPHSLAILKAETNSGQLATGIRELSNVLGISVNRLLKPDQLGALSSAGVRFKKSKSAPDASVQAFAVYAHYVAALSVDASINEKVEDLPKSWASMRKLTLENFGNISFSTVLRQAWRCGVIVIPMREAGAFHGAVWMIRGTPVIVLKQTNLQASRWLFDLLHEVAHIANGDVDEDSAVVEDHPVGMGSADDDEEEEAANEWAEDFLLDGRSDEIEAECQRSCGGRLEKLASVVPGIASKFKVDLGFLANYMAWRLDTVGQDWWGTATKLQISGVSPFDEACSELWDNIDLSRLNPFDRELFIRSLQQ